MTSQALRRRRGPRRAASVAGHAAPVLLLAPSRGLGGGIERYVQTVQSAFDDRGVARQRLDLPRPGPAGHRALLTEAAAALTGQVAPHAWSSRTGRCSPWRRCLPGYARCAASPSSATASMSGASRTGLRWQLESRLMRRRGVRIVAVSSFTAGALFPGGQATILPPGPVQGLVRRAGRRGRRRPRASVPGWS